MKIAIPAKDRQPSAAVDDRLGRAQWFVLYDTDTQAWDAIENAPTQQPLHGAGVQSGESLIRAGVTAVLATHCGPNAFRVLQASGITVFLGAQGTVAETLAAYQSGSLQPADAADVGGHR